MAIQFVNNVDFGFYNTKGFALENLSTAPLITVEGSMYYDTDDNKPYYRNDSEWVDLAGVTTFSNVNGTFISCTTVNTSASGDVTLGTIDLSATETPTAVKFLRGDNTWNIPPGEYLNWRIQADDSGGAPNPSTVLHNQIVDIAGGTAIGTEITTSTPSEGTTYTVTIDNEGVTQITAGDNISIDSSTGNVEITSTDEFVGTVTSVGSGDGLTGGPINASTPSGTLAVDYVSTDNIILAAADGTGVTLTLDDKVLVSTGDAKYTKLLQIKTLFAPVTSVTGTAPVVSSGGLTPAISVTTAAPESGNANLSTSGQIYDFVTGQGYEDGTVTSVTVSATTGLTSTGSPILASGEIILGLDYTGLDNYIVIRSTETAVAADSIAFSDATDNNVKESTFGTIPITALTLVKEYIDSTVGALIYQGSYNATTNSPNLDLGTNIAIEKGWVYTVSIAGDFFTEAVQVGDLLIAEEDMSADGGSTLAKWTIVQGNTDLATASAVGIGNVVPGSSSTITAPYTTGTATLDVVDSAAAQKGAIIVAGGDGITVTYSSGTATIDQDTGSGKSKKVVLDSGDAGVAVATVGDDKIWTLTVDNAAIFGSGALSANIMAECYKVSNGITAYPEVVRSVSSTEDLEFKFNMPVPPSDGDYVVLLHNVAGI